MVLTQSKAQAYINTLCRTRRHHLIRHPLFVSQTHSHTETCAYRKYFKSLMCKQLLLFAQTTCSFWTQTTLWRTVRFNSAGCIGDAVHERSLSAWCRLHQMVWPCRTAASFNRTRSTDVVCGLEDNVQQEMAGRRAQNFGRCPFTVTAQRRQRIGSPLCSLSAKRWVHFSRAEALGGMITKVIKGAIAKSQQESGNATYSISLSYGIYRKNTDKQRA